jgi:protein required for attachment to host cells
MPTKLRIPHDAWVFVGDGRKALFLRNEGDERFPNLKVETVLEDEIPATHELGTDRPGRTFASVGARRAGVDQTDWHDLEERDFARHAAQALEKVVRARKAKALVVVAPPRTLAELRQAWHDDVRQVVIAEIDKDLTGHPVDKIERLLTE